MNATPGIPPFPDFAAALAAGFGLPPERRASFAGRLYWITGAGTGYGRSIAWALAACGARVALSGRRSEKLRETAEMAARFGIAARSFLILPADICDAESVQAAAGEIQRSAGRLDGLIASAALPQPPLGPAPLATASPEQWAVLMRTNAFGAWTACRAALPLLRGSDRPRILLLSSEAGWAATPGFGLYDISKAALNSLGYNLAHECAALEPERDWQINTLIPAEARTEMNRGSDLDPAMILPMTLALLGHPPGGPNGHFFHRDGRHFSFAYSAAYDRPLL